MSADEGLSRFVAFGWKGGAGTNFDAWLTSSAAQVSRTQPHLHVSEVDA